MYNTYPLQATTLLQTRALMGEFRGRELRKIVSEKIDQLPENGVLILDFVDALFLDYNFSSSCLDMLFPSSEKQCKRVLFKVHRKIENAFFHGLMKLVSSAVGPYNESKQTFAQSGNHCKLVSLDEQSIEYVGELDQNEEVVLEALAKLRSGEINDIKERTQLHVEAVHFTLMSLHRKGFILESASSPGPTVYHSFEGLLTAPSVNEGV